ncbi:MAG: hypothetical protein COC09_08405 [Gammaproteobacteria bacterium]|nr:hypothetical protein [Gammaproteobacteria bacterium]PCH62476.1 MAG: hypothetical protein COC09_08405 [Gammaproteobacteria bacterium]
MPQIELTKAEPGMVLAADVIGPGDRILVTAGSELSVRQIELLKTRDITEVDIHEIAPPAGVKEISSELLEMMAHRFRENGDHPFINELKRIWLEEASKK